MIVKIGNNVYTEEDGLPIMLILSVEDKNNLMTMEPEATKYAIFPDGMDESEMRSWMVDIQPARSKE